MSRQTDIQSSLLNDQSFKMVKLLIEHSIIPILIDYHVEDMQTRLQQQKDDHNQLNGFQGGLTESIDLNELLDTINWSFFLLNEFKLYHKQVNKLKYQIVQLLSNKQVSHNLYGTTFFGQAEM